VEIGLLPRVEMKPTAHQRRREAGLALVDACEQALGVRGPTALAALTGRSKSWWSKLTSGIAAFPSWEEVEALLPAGVTNVARERLHLSYRKTWLWLCDPVLLDRLDAPVPPQVSLEDLYALRNSAGVLAQSFGDHRTALRLMDVLELLLVPRGIDALSGDELGLLQDCLNLQSVCKRELGDFETAVSVAQRSVKYQQTGCNPAGVALARHALGLEQGGAGIHLNAAYLTKALKTYEQAQREFERLDLAPKAIAARRDIGATKLQMNRPEEGEAALLQAYEMPNQTGDSQFRTVLWLVQASLRRENVEQARRWLARTRIIARRHPDEIAALMSVRYIARDVAQLERAVADPLPQRKG
jgi:tetratricopeptide (TPR) repeat protein